MVQMQANQHLLLQPWILAERIGSIVLSGYILDTTPDVISQSSCYYVTIIRYYVSDIMCHNVL